MGYFYLLGVSWKYSGCDRWKVVLFYALHAVSLCGELVQPYAFGKAVNALQVNGLRNLQPAFVWLGVYLAGFMVFQVFHHTARYFEFTTGFKNRGRFTADMYDRLCRLPMQWHNDHHSGDVVNRINTAAQAVSDFSLSQFTYLGLAFLSIGPVVVLAGMDWQVAVISLALITLTLAVVMRLNRAIHPILQCQNERLHAYAAGLFDYVGNIKTVITLGLGRQTSQELDGRFRAYYCENMREFWINQPRCFIIAFGAIFTELAVILFYVLKCRRLGLPLMIGTLVIVVTYFRQLRESFFGISEAFFSMLRWKAAVQAIETIIAKSERQDRAKAAASWETFSVRQLCFQYGKEKRGLHSVDLDIGSQDKVAVVGVSGSGKSTLLSVLAGLYDPQEAVWATDGAGYSIGNPLVGVAVLAPQDPEIFENTIQFNITFGLDFPDGNLLNEVIDSACFREVLNRLPNGLRTDIRERGVNLSGGEKQRLALARGLYFAGARRVLLLDEVTSSVDPINERQILANILHHYADRCIVATIHRLHMLPMFDAVWVMEDGRIVQRGTFDELRDREGPFRRLWEMYLLREDEMKSCPAR